MIPSLHIASYFIQKAVQEGKPLTHLKLQKLMYFAQGWYLAETGEPLLDEVLEDWKYGPVVPSVYRKLAHHAGDTITRAPVASDKLRIDETTRKFLDVIYHSYAKYSAGQLVNLTHALQSPWDEIVHEWGGVLQLPKNLNIPNEVLRDHFQRRRATLRSFRQAA